MTGEKPKLLHGAAILTRRLKEGKTYEDFRKAWFHTTGFGVPGLDAEGSGFKLLTFINMFDPREIIVIGFGAATLEQLKAALDIDVEVRGKNPLDDVIEPEIGRTFAAQVAEDDFSAVGNIAYTPPMIGGVETDMKEFYDMLATMQEIYAAAGKKRDEINKARKKQGGAG